MTLEGVLFVLLIVSLPGDWIVFGILVTESVKKPYVAALSLMTFLAGLIALGLTAYVLAVFNSSLGYILPKEIGQIGLRTALAGFAVFPYLFLWLYRTGRFRDGDPL